MLNSRTTRKLGWSRQLLNGHEGALMKASLFMAAALYGAGTPASARSVVGTVPAHGGHLVAISPQLPDVSLSMAERDAATFHFPTTHHHACARSQPPHPRT